MICWSFQLMKISLVFLLFLFDLFFYRFWTDKKQVDICLSMTSQVDDSDRWKRRLIRPETAIKRLNSCRKRCKTRPFFTVFHRFYGRNPSSQITERISPKTKTAPFPAVSVEQRRVVLIAFSPRLVSENQRFQTFTTTHLVGHTHLALHR
jgi:hypothetical protein